MNKPEYSLTSWMGRSDNSKRTNAAATINVDCETQEQSCGPKNAARASCDIEVCSLNLTGGTPYVA